MQVILENFCVIKIFNNFLGQYKKTNDNILIPFHQSYTIWATLHKELDETQEILSQSTSWK